MRPFQFRATTLSCCLATVATLTFGPNALADEEKVVNIYNWADYIAPDTIKNFEKETGIKVRYDNFDSNEVLHAKLVAGRTGYDVVVPGSHFAKMQIDGGLLLKLDKSQLPNLKNLDPSIQAQLAKLDPGNDYLVDWLWGYTTVGINAEKVKKALGALPMPDNVWDLVFKPEYASKLKGCGVSFLDTASEVIPIALKYIGKDPHSKDAADYKAAGEMLKSRAALRDPLLGLGLGLHRPDGARPVVRRGRLVRRHLHRQGPRSQGQATPGAGSPAAQGRQPALLRRDGDTQGRQAPRERAQVDQLHHAPRGARVVDQRRVLCEPESGSPEVRQARVGQRQGGVP